MSETEMKEPEQPKEPEKIMAFQDYIFKNDYLDDSAAVITTARTKQDDLFLQFMENIPVSTFRGGNYFQDVSDSSKTWEEAVKKHDANVSKILGLSKKKEQLKK